VQEGEYGFYDRASCKASDTCYAINPLTPYGLSWLPPHPSADATDVKYENSCAKHKMCRGNMTDPWGPAWRVARGETVVIVGRSPPEAVYWSFSPTLYSRYHKAPFIPRLGGLGNAIVACPPALVRGNRCEVFSGINDPVNFLSANFTGVSPFGTEFALVVSWDEVSERKAVQELEKAGQQNVNVLRMPGQIGELGVTTGREDEWMTILRVEGIKNETAAMEFYGGSPFRTFRVTPPDTFKVSDADLFPSFDGNMRQRVLGTGEGTPDASYDDLRSALEKLQAQIIEREEARFNGTRRHLATASFETFVNDSGYECLNHGTKCQGDCRDTIYAKSTFLIRQIECLPVPKFGPCNPAESGLLSEIYGDSLFAIGVNHKQTNQALYSSVTAYDFPKLAAVSSAVTDEMYSGTANKYLGEEDPAAKYLYVVKFARSCGLEDEDLCIEIPSGSDDPLVSPLALDKPIVFLERMYINPKTLSGPAVSETILGKLLHFKPHQHFWV